VSLDSLVHLVTMHDDMLRGFDSDSHLVAADLCDHDADVIADHDGFRLLPAKYQHCRFLSLMCVKTPGRSS